MVNRKTKRMRLVEAKYGRPLEEVLGSLYRDLGSIQGVARALGTSRCTVWMWMRLCDIEVRQWLLPGDGQQDSKDL